MPGTGVEWGWGYPRGASLRGVVEGLPVVEWSSSPLFCPTRLLMARGQEGPLPPSVTQAGSEGRTPGFGTLVPPLLGLRKPSPCFSGPHGER